MTSTASPRHVAATTRTTLGLWQYLTALCFALTLLLACMPDGVAEPIQAVIAWLVVGVAATLSVLVIVKGLERLLDCEAD